VVLKPKTVLLTKVLVTFFLFFHLEMKKQFVKTMLALNRFRFRFFFFGKNFIYKPAILNLLVMS
jgi:hypothetical protein